MQRASLLLKGMADYARGILANSSKNGRSRPRRKNCALLISADRQVHADVQQALQEQWDLLLAKNLREAQSLWRGREIGIVLLDRDTLPRDWRAAVSSLSNPPYLACVIVLSRAPGRNDWEEVVKLGGYELLCGPAASENLLRAVKSGWSYWQSQQGLRVRKVLP